jgi:hypothetical protein
MIAADLLRRLRNDLPMPVAIAALGCDGPPSKMSEGYFRFLCPRCGEMRATVNPRNNLAHCFHCNKNLNNIDLLITLGYDFRAAVAVLENLLNRYEDRLPKKKHSGCHLTLNKPTLFDASPISTICNAPVALPDPRATLLQTSQQFGKQALTGAASVQR